MSRTISSRPPFIPGVARNLAFLLLLFVLARPSCAQVATGTPPFGSFGGGPDTINLGNLNAHLTIPVLHKPGRDTNFTYDLTYDSSVWYPVGSSGSQSWQPVANWGWTSSTAAVSGSLYYAVLTAHFCPYFIGRLIGYHGTTYTRNNWTFYDDLGTPHYFSGYTQVSYSNDPSCTAPPPVNLNTTVNDGSGYNLQASGGSGTVYNTKGTQIGPPINAFAGPGTLTDRNGNIISIDNSGNITDTLGIVALAVSGTGTPASPITFTYTAPSGANAAYTVKYTTYSIQTNFGCSGITEYGTNGTTTANLVSEIDLPDWNTTTNPNSRYTFAYEPTPGHSGFVTSRLASITLPTGGTISYAYSGGSNGVVCADGSTATLTRTTPDGTWTYAHSESGTAWSTLITDSQNNQTNMNFQGIYETERQVYQGSTSGTLLRQWFTCYNGAASPCNSTAITLPINRRTVTDQYGSSGLQCKHDYFYNSVGGPTEQDDYDYGSGSSGSLLRKTLITYASLGNITAFRQTVTICNGTGSSSSCAGPSGGNTGSVIARTNYNYDEPNTLTATSGIAQHTSVSGSRGNLTSINYPVSGLTSHFTYYDTGSPNTSQDVNGATTAYNYSSNTADCQMAFPTSISEPLSMSKSFAWNCTGGVMTSVTDENSKTSTFSYANDPYYWRANSSTDQANWTTTFCYGLLTNGNCTLNPNQSESLLTYDSGYSVRDVLTTLDSLGRPHLSQTRQGPNYTTFDTVETDYDGLGRVSRLTLPYSGTAGQTCPSCPATTNSYDSLSRISQITDAGGGTTTYSPYSNNDVVITSGPAPLSENTKRHQLEYDALGRLTSVCEITGGTTGWPGGTCSQNSPQTGYWTKYTYDAAGNLLTATQNAQSTSSQQTRSFSFDPMARLISETNAESGTTTYTYDTDATCTPASSGDLVKRIDAIGNTTCFAYDGLHRKTGITYPSGAYASITPAKHFVYDSATVNGVATTNAMGRLAEAYTCTGSCSSKTTDEGFSYTARGETSDTYESTPNSGGYYHLNQTYWAHGLPLKLIPNITGLPNIQYGAGAEGRIGQVSASTGTNPVACCVSYNPASLPLSVPFGTGDSDSFTYDSNTLRMTQYKFTVGSSPQSLIGKLTWNANSTLAQLTITDPFNSADTQTCNYSYDDLVRIAGANCGSAADQTFSYDPFGNISKSGSPYTFQPSYSASTNHMTSIAGFTPTYDSNGNVTNDGNHTYSWDANGNAIAIDSVSLTFDALDRMVEQNRSGSYAQIVYAPTGVKLAVMNRQTLQKAFIPLPGQATAVYTSSGLDHYRHPDWLGSARLTSSPSRTYLSSAAYAPFGEIYAASGSTDPSFTGMNPDTVSTDYDFLFREYSNEGRWVSPDPTGLAAVHPSNPQSWNRYAYVTNDPLRYTDPSGRDLVDDLWGGWGGGGAGGACFMCGAYNIDYYLAMDDLKFFGLAYYQIPGHSGYGSNGAEEEARYVSIMNTGWDPDLGRWEWGWHSLEGDLRLAMMNYDCAALVGGTDVGSALVANMSFMDTGTAAAIINLTNPAPSNVFDPSYMDWYRLQMQPLQRVANGLKPALTLISPDGKFMGYVVGPSFAGLSVPQQMTVMIHEFYHAAGGPELAGADISAACGTAIP